MNVPILLICGCQKYKEELLRAIKRFEHSSYRTIGIIGDPSVPTHFNGVYLSLEVEDTYEALPMKIQTAFAWIYANYPNTAGIFKTDDDIYFDNIDTVVQQIRTHQSIPYWGHRLVVAEAGPYRQVDYKRYSNGVRPIKEAARYCGGNGYWISNLMIPTIINSSRFTYGAEDYIMGTILNNAGHEPVHFPLKFNQYRQKCWRKDCTYKIHSNSNNNNGLYCCRACQLGGGHGPACEKATAGGFRL